MATCVRVCATTGWSSRCKTSHRPTPPTVTWRSSVVSTPRAPLGYGHLPPTGVPRPVHALEIAIDCLDRKRIRPFWKAVLGYVDEPGPANDNGIVDPTRQGPSVWFQHMDEPRRQRNRIHFDITVPHEEAQARIAAAMAAGGRLVSDTHAGVLDPRRRRGKRDLRVHVAGPRSSRSAAVGVNTPVESRGPAGRNSEHATHLAWLTRF